jgi:tRNA(Ile)-lysidine synthase
MSRNKTQIRPAGITAPGASALASLTLDAQMLKPGMRIAVGLSGGSDSVALLRALAACSGELGLVVHAAHLHHGLRGEEADGDLDFARDLAATLGLPFHQARVDVAKEAQSDAASGKAAETLEEAARRVRYAWFRQLLATEDIDAVATAHTLDDQAETVLAKFLRGAWTEGLAGIAPKLEFPEGTILRPLLNSTRAEIEAYLTGLGQTWREDSSNRHLAFTRNRIRHELLPLLTGWNPRLREHLAQMAVLAADEEAWWDGELSRVAPQILLPGRAVRGGGRAAGGDPALAIDVKRLAGLAPALQRRLLRHAAGKLGSAPDFDATEAMRELALTGRAGQRLELAKGLRAERTPRELRLENGPASRVRSATEAAPSEYKSCIPCKINAPEFGLEIAIELAPASRQDLEEGIAAGAPVTLRNWKPGDRVRLRYSSGPRKVKEVLERLKVTGSGRSRWPVLEFDGRILWMQGVELEPEPGIAITVGPQGDSLGQVPD